VTVDTKLADAYSLDIVIAFFSGKRSSQLVGLLPPREIALSSFHSLQKLPIIASCRSLGHVAVLINMTDHPPRSTNDHRLSKLLSH